MMRDASGPTGLARESPAEHALLGVAGLVTLLPFLWMLLTAFKTQHQVTVSGGVWPQPWAWGNFADAWQAAPFARYFLNSLIVTAGTTLLQLFVASLAGFAFARLKFAGREAIFVLFLATMMIPQELTLIPDYILMSDLHWLDTYQALIVPWGASPIAIFLMRQTLRGLPDELADAARIDGCGNGGFLWRVALPLSRPALTAVAIFAIVGSWNDFTWPLVMTSTDAMRTVQVGISYFAQGEGTQYGPLMAGSTLVILPLLVVFLALQRTFVQGIAHSGLK